ncbi:increased DNA methylation 1 [Artemisia annua]|uniref:Increased DNA methylation 1 n=1 Tax=Artemisia annua TaxID=35608 RepID=A0A2U1NZD0_ARTAN|nr:increased DNA methylation 1 [Artemisia annua]
MERKGFHDVDVEGDDSNDHTCGSCRNSIDFIRCDRWPSTFRLTFFNTQFFRASFTGDVGEAIAYISLATQMQIIICYWKARGVSYVVLAVSELAVKANSSRTYL